MAGAFFAGYQVAVARIFPEFDRAGVSCFAATTRPEARRCTLTRTEDGLHLDGDKTWVACIDHLDRLVVLVEGEDGPAYVDVPATAAGVALHNPGTASFLPELSQGAAHFDAVIVNEGSVALGEERARRFRRAERFHVLCAIAQLLGDPTAADTLRSIDARLSGGESVRTELDALGRDVRTAFESPEAADLRATLAPDRRLLDMFAPADSR